MSDPARTTCPDTPAGPEAAVCATLAPGLHLATAAELADALAAVPDGAVCMGGSVGPDAAEVEFVEFDDPFPFGDGELDVEDVEFAGSVPACAAGVRGGV